MNTPDAPVTAAIKRWRNNLAITREDPIDGDYLHGPALEFVISELDSILACALETSQPADDSLQAFNRTRWPHRGDEV